MNEVKLQLSTLSLEQKQLIYRAPLSDDDLNNAPVLDDVIPRNREIKRFMFLLDRLYFSGNLISDSNDFYYLSIDQFKHLQALSMQQFGITPRQIFYRGNTFTADIYLRAFPFIEVKQLFI